MSITKNVNGYYVISDIIDGYLVTKTYGGYSRKESIRLFKQEVKK